MSLLLVGGVNNQPFFILVIVELLIRRVSEHSLPALVIEVRKVIGGCGDSGEPIIKDDMELGCDVANLRVENEGNGTCMFVRESKVDGASGARSPARQFLVVRNHFVKDKYWASPDVYIRQVLLFPSGFYKDIRGRESGLWVSTRNTARLTASGHRVGSATSGQWIAECNNMVLAIAMMVRMLRSAMPL